MMSAETADPAAATATAVPSAKLRNVCMVIRPESSSLPACSGPRRPTCPAPDRVA